MLTVAGLWKRFHTSQGHVHAVQDLNLAVEEGEFFVLVGASGSGKTTLLRCVAGLDQPDQGNITIDGRTVFSSQPTVVLPPQSRQLGMVFQSYAIWPHLTVFENVALPLKTGEHRIPGRQVHSRAMNALELVQLHGLADRPATALSGGQQQRIALARALAVNPKLLLMDEPLSNLDARLREEVRIQILELVKELRTTVLYVTHDQVEAMSLADRIGLMSNGRLLQVGNPASLYRRPESQAVADFMGHVSWLPGTILDPGVVSTPVGLFRTGVVGFNQGEFVNVGFRPESVIASTGMSDLNSFAASLISSTFLGEAYQYKLSAAGYTILARMAEPPGETQEQLTVRVRPEDVFVFNRESGGDSGATSPSAPSTSQQPEFSVYNGPPNETT